MANPKSTCVKCGRRCHGETCYVCNRKTALEEQKANTPSKLTNCRWCNRVLKTGATVCTKDDCRPPADIVLPPMLLRSVAAAVVTGTDRFPVETTGAIPLPTPGRSGSGSPRWGGFRGEITDRDEKREARLQEMRLTACDCPTCGGKAWEEPPVTRTRNGVTTVEKFVRCPKCNPARHRASGKRVVA